MGCTIPPWFRWKDVPKIQISPPIFEFTLQQQENYYCTVIQAEVVTLNKILGSIFRENMMKNRELLIRLF